MLGNSSSQQNDQWQPSKVSFDYFNLKTHQISFIENIQREKKPKQTTTKKNRHFETVMERLLEAIIWYELKLKLH